jgi:hypothetical protein
MHEAKRFADSVLARLRVAEPCAKVLQTRPDGSDAVLDGLEEDKRFVALFRLAAASNKLNVMSLHVRYKDLWMRLERGTPDVLAKSLLGPTKQLWKPAVIAARLPEFSDE